jgi:hypothetical protein
VAYAATYIGQRLGLAGLGAFNAATPGRKGDYATASNSVKMQILAHRKICGA